MLLCYVYIPIVECIHTNWTSIVNASVACIMLVWCVYISDSELDKYVYIRIIQICGICTCGIGAYSTGPHSRCIHSYIYMDMYVHIYKYIYIYIHTYM